jgi:autotransporter translocation and assembly factor TamB
MDYRGPMDTKELLFEITAHITGNVEFGASLQAVASGKAAPPPEGARFDISVEGTVEGPKLKGKVYVIDYANVRADGRLDLHIHGRIELADGGKVAVSAKGLATPDPTGIMQLRHTWTLTSNSPAHSWVNSTPVWASGTANLATGELRLKGYRA